MTPLATTDELIFYTKDGCALCEEALRFIRPLAKKHSLRIVDVDIDEASGDIWYRHRYRIPVVEFRGEELGWGRIDHGIEETSQPSIVHPKDWRVMSPEVRRESGHRRPRR